MQNFMKTILSAVQTWTKAKIKESTADWNQNDATADNYVKNRPFYASMVDVDMAPFQRMTMSEVLEDTGETFVFLYRGEDSLFNKERFYDGKPLKIIMNGTEYSCVWHKHAEHDAWSAETEAFIVGLDGTWGEIDPETDEVIAEFYSDLYVTFPTTVDTANYTIQILDTVEKVQKIDWKFLPDNTATTESVQNALDIANSKMDATNPFGTGNFSLNRQSNSATGDYSSAIGVGTVASRKSQTVLGEYNVPEVFYEENIVEGATDDFTINGGRLDTSYTIDPVTGEYVISSNNYVGLSQSKLRGKYTILKDGKLGVSTRGYILYEFPSDFTATVGGDFWGPWTSNNITVGYKIHTVNMLTSDKGNYTHIVGNGTSDDARSNAHTLDWEGNAWYSGDVYVGSTSGTNRDEGSKKLATEEFVSTAIADASLSGGEVDLSAYATKSELPTKTSQLTNDSGFITGYTETDPTVPAWAKAATKPTYTASEVGALPADTVIPTVPTKVSAFTNDAGYLTQHQSLAGYAKTADLGDLATKDSLTAADVGALPVGTTIPSKTSQLTNDSGFITGYTETDPTVPAWAKTANKPTYTASEVGADASGTASATVAAHNSDANAHADIRNAMTQVKIITWEADD